MAGLSLLLHNYYPVSTYCHLFLIISWNNITNTVRHVGGILDFGRSQKVNILLWCWHWLALLVLIMYIGRVSQLVTRLITTLQNSTRNMHFQCYKYTFRPTTMWVRMYLDGAMRLERSGLSSVVGWSYHHDYNRWYVSN